MHFRRTAFWTDVGETGFPWQKFELFGADLASEDSCWHFVSPDFGLETVLYYDNIKPTAAFCQEKSAKRRRFISIRS
jgi:hypothetical protein